MPFTFRRSKKVGPVRLTLGKRGVSTNVKAGPVTVGRSARGRRTLSVRILRGLGWRR